MPTTPHLKTRLPIKVVASFAAALVVILLTLFRLNLKIMGQHDELEEKLFEERAALENKYQKLYETLFPKRKEYHNNSINQGLVLYYKTKLQVGLVVVMLEDLLQIFLFKSLAGVTASTAYVPVRNIHDNVIIAHEMMQYMKTTKATQGVVGVKLDMAKAFDRMEWYFLHQIMSHLGFSQKWCQIINKCISTGKISILINGNPMEFFSPTRGLRQGDSISPYLFILYMEGFSRLLSNAANQKIIKPVIPTKTGPAISHLLFADDCILFTKANERSINNLKELIHKFTSSSGQMVNLEKSSVFFRKNLNEDDCNNIINWLQMKKMDEKEKYLGTLLQTPRSKDKFFDNAVNQMDCMLQTWQGKLTSQAGRTTHIQASLSTKANYQMGLFEVPEKTITRMERIQRNYFWSKKNAKGGNNKSWSKINKPKRNGGLGLKDLKVVNHTLLAKLAWRLIHEKEAMWYKVLEARYFKGKDLLLDNTAKKRSSWIWLNIQTGLEIIKKYYIWEIGDGTSVKAQMHRCYPNSEDVNPEAASSTQQIHNNIMVADLISQDTRTWNVSKLNNHFNSSQVQQIRNIRIPSSALHQSKKNHNTVKEWIISWFADENSLEATNNLLAKLAPYGIYGKQDVRKNCISQHENWKKPPYDWIKINIDASFVSQNTNAGFALIIRNSAGGFLAAMAFSARARDVNQAESLVLLRALQWVQEMNLKNVIIEGDNRSVIECCNSSVEGFKWEDQNVIIDCQKILQNLESCLKRYGNSVADKLAKFARTSIRFQVWREDPPNIIASILEMESKN
ncbi:uncharacterized protein LOC113331389 [Papaver somniferum]|uniref:uncharacterized protein LOC113331389 n=1 Tax=Papaver somniferum TaxID=3469 RepID=UPI000E6FCCA4|nr:uncharacterized protein LOC113331389 [Papaver somniferum]